ncbi:uncharacterized protein LOC108738065 [Agrilus planipennis]|uniref:Uncharacterized protein LOC108738065 n=1 Tax=Agrilus planipennis TaxID=224129 RepID=A0A1W4X332_AGRPL|nr:uncharacterized protein LOC108738065 [Agrilus planipennis]
MQHEKPDNNFDINSIISAFECDAFQNTFSTCRRIDISKAGLSSQLDDVILWLNNGFTPMTLTTLESCTLEEVQNCIAKIAYILIKFTDIKNVFQKALKNNQNKNNSVYIFNCKVCNENIKIPKGVNFWTALQNHEHIEEALAFMKNMKQPVNSAWHNQLFNESNLVFEEVNNQQNEENNIFLQQINRCIVKRSVNENSQLDNEEKYCKQISNIENEKYMRYDNGNFIFKFNIDYDEQIKKRIYPRSLLEKVNNIDLLNACTVQRRGPDCVFCLLCQREVPFHSTFKAVFEHASGHKHSLNAKKKKMIDALQKYHEVWMRQDLEYQSHQTHFLPYTVEMTSCLLCSQFVHYNNLITHIEDKSHKSLILQLQRAKRRNIVYLTELQITVYNQENNGLDQVDQSNQNSERLHGRVQVPDEDTASESESSSSVNIKNTNCENCNNIEALSIGNNLIINNLPPTKPKHLIVKAILKNDSKDIGDLLENRYLNHLNVIKQEKNIITCTTCKVSFNLNMPQLHQHILSQIHRNLTGIPIPSYRYQCDICNTIFRKQEHWTEHLKQVLHRERCRNVESSTNSALIEYECKTCRVVIFGDDISKQTHEQLKVRKLREKDIVLNDKAKLLLQSEAHIAQESIKMIVAASKVLDHLDEVNYCCARIEQVLSEDLGIKCKAYPFGSRISGLTCDENSDLDVFVDLGGMYNGACFQDAKHQEEFVKRCAKVFRKRSSEFTDINSIPTARTPIVQVYHKLTNIDCDLSFKNGLSVENTKFLKFCVLVQPAAQSLILYLKEWSKVTKMNERITTYAVAMMAIFFLQMNSYLLPVEILKRLMSNAVVHIDGWEAIDLSDPFYQLSKIPKHNLTIPIKTLLMNFFEFYASFDFKKMVVCPLLGKPVPKASFIEKSNGECLPAEMLPYITKLKCSDDAEVFRALSPLCIQDPFDLSHNLTKACSNDTATKLKRLFALSHKHLQQQAT